MRAVFMNWATDIHLATSIIYYVLLSNLNYNPKDFINLSKIKLRIVSDAESEIANNSIISS